MPDQDVDERHADERLTLGQIESGGLLAATHVQRYALATELGAKRRVVDLCCGTGYGSARLGERATDVVGVDIAEEALEEARELTREQANVRFVASDAADYLEDLTPDDVDLIVCFEGIEHVPDPRRVAETLGRLAARGVAVLVSVPNSAGFEEENEFHVTDFDFQSATGLAELLGPEVLRLDQTHGDAAVLLPADDAVLPPSAEAVFDTDRAPDPAVVTHWIFAVNVAAEELERTRIRVAVSARPHHYGYMLSLERANQELWATNARMSRSWVGVYDAAAGRAARLRGEIRALQKENASLIERLESAVESARLNDQMFQDARLLLLERQNEILQLRRGPFLRAVRAVYRRLRGLVQRG